ncbi:general secretion pathway protein GspF [Desulfonema ishimotonii]|uniref:General secretion pathway protein GspF n=1 Tax=Desulfonema ishimotonii TaxID=45657 RepID=A0A401FQI6_9BACT|nr:type II secretion system F family protein [Desulfonema ishimotonii]GBC59125.1 general secretion pathway protein GspF [Desulfonema ishimotonii]
MTKFSYDAIGEDGRMVSGEVDAESDDVAENMILDFGYIPSKIKKKREISLNFRWSDFRKRVYPVKTRDIILFTRQFATMIRTGVPIIELLQALEEQTENQTLRKTIKDIAFNLKQGGSLYNTFRKYPDIFSPLYCSVIQAGERTGALSDVLDRLTYIMEHEDKIKSDVRSALRYPMIVCLFLCVAFLVLLIFVIPKFVTIFEAAGLELPLPTRICILTYYIFNQYWYILLLAAVAVFSSMTIYFRTEYGKFIRDSVMIRLPVLGKFLLKAAMSRFASIFFILQYSGVPVLESMSILSGTIGNAAISHEFLRIRSDIEKGSSIAAPLKSAKYFTPMVINMVAIGEKTENLDRMLHEVANHYDSEVEYAMKGISEYINPLLTIGIAFVVGFFALAIFLPMWDMTKITG